MMKHIKALLQYNISYTIKALFIVLFAICILLLNTTQQGISLKDNTIRAFHKSAINNGFALKSVYIQGRINTPKQQIINAITIKTGDSMFRVDTQDIKNKISKIGWINTVSVERRFPNTIYITVKEKKPVAIWQLNGTLSIIDKNGDVLSKNQLKKFSHLKILVGKNANKKVLDFMRIIAHDTTLSKMVSAGIWISKRRWNVVLLNRIEVKLPSVSPNLSWVKLGKYAKKKNLLTRDIKSIDLRITDKIFLKMNTPKKKKGNKA